MAVLTFANTKGGAGKTTAVVIVACELARMGFSVAVLDADPQLWISKWYERLADRAPSALSVIPYVTAANLGHYARKLRNEVDFLLIDLPGARSPLLAQALGYSNYVLIPVQGSAMDAEGATNVIELLQYLEDRADIRIPHSVVLTRVNPMVTTRALQSVKELLSSRRVHVLSTPIIERAAYREVFGYGQTLYSIDRESVSNLDKARQNAQALAQEVLRRILPYSGRADQTKAENQRLSA